MNTTLINIFKERIMEETGSFTIGCKEKYGSTRYYEFMQRTVDEARFVYLSSNFRESDRYSYNQKFDLAAIIVDEKIYLVDTYHFGIIEGVEYPENVFVLNDVCEEVKGHIQKEMSELIKGELVGMYAVDSFIYDEECEKEARRCVLKGTNPECDFNLKLHAQDVVNVICGFQRMNDLIDDIINGANKPYYQFVAWKCNKIKELMESGMVEEWERELAECLQESNAKNVNVKFIREGNSETVKINRETVLNSLIWNRYFTEYTFECSTTEGRNIMSHLNIGYRDRLECKHIAEITFGCKTLYKRENN